VASIAQAAPKPGPLKRARFWAAGFKERDTWVAYGFLLPWFIGFAIFIAGPMIASLILSFTDYSVIETTHWVGTQNYHDLVHDPKVGTALKNSFIFTLLSVPLHMIVALALAIILLHVGRAAGFFRTVFYLPSMTPPVAVAILYLLLFNGSTGIINRVLGWFGIDGPFWTTDPTWVKPGLALMSAWAVGGTMVIYLAALRGVPQHLYEAAAMDGASSWRRFRDVTLPMISPALFFTFIILTIGAMTEFTKVYTAFFGAGTSTNETEAALLYSVYLFRQSFEFFHFGYASALAWLLFVIIMVITLVQVRVSKRFVFYQGEARR
jgi:multiple sugar transport system permease protein